LFVHRPVADELDIISSPSPTIPICPLGTAVPLPLPVGLMMMSPKLGVFVLTKSCEVLSRLNISAVETEYLRIGPKQFRIIEDTESAHPRSSIARSFGEASTPKKERAVAYSLARFAWFLFEIIVVG
jgi:hypothetical protein